MKLAFDEYYTTVADYNRAEFELFHAMGYPAQELTLRQPAGPRPTGRPDAADLPAPGRQRAASGHPLIGPTLASCIATVLGPEAAPGPAPARSRGGRDCRRS